MISPADENGLRINVSTSKTQETQQQKGSRLYLPRITCYISKQDKQNHTFTLFKTQRIPVSTSSAFYLEHSQNSLLQKMSAEKDYSLRNIQDSNTNSFSVLCSVFVMFCFGNTITFLFYTPCLFMTIVQSMWTMCKRPQILKYGQEWQLKSI